jgi:C4-dicarboxylate-specific signal transduction histidine kinase
VASAFGRPLSLAVAALLALPGSGPALLLGQTPSGPSTGVPGRRVLLLSEYGRIPALALVDSVLQHSLPDSALGITYDSELLDVARFGDSAYATRALEYLGRKYAADQPDVILAPGFQAVWLADRLRRQSFPHASIIFLGVDERLLDSLPRGAPLTGVSLRYDFAGTGQAIRALQPEVRRVVLIAGVSPFDLQWLPVAHRELAALGYDIAELVGLPLAVLRDSVARLGPSTAIVYLNVFRDRQGGRYVGRTVGMELARVASVPMYTVHDIGLGTGIVGGRVVSYASQARLAAELARRVLAGAPASGIPVIRDGALVYEFDWRALRRWRLSDRKLPPGSVVLFRKPSFYEQYRLEVLGIGLALLVQAGLIAALLAARRRQRRAQTEAERRLRLEQLVSGLSGSFVEVPIEQTDEAIQHWLTRLRESFEVDRVRLARFRSDGSLAHVTLSADQAVVMERLALDVPGDQMPELVGRLFHGGELRIASVDRELTAYPGDRQLLQSLGTRSVLALPLPGKDRAVGAISLGMVQRERVWTDAEVQELRLVAEVFSNVLRRQDAEAEMDRQAQEAAHAGRVATLGELAASLAHELNQPLTAILSNANAARRFLEAEPPDLKEVREILADIAADDRRASEVIQRMRAMLRKGELDRRVLDLNELVTDAVRLVSSDAVLRQVRIDEQLATSVIQIIGDRVQLQQVVINLLLNGLDVSAELSHPRRIVIGTGAWNQEATVTLRDWGPGIPTEALAHIFEPFYTTKRAGLGMGLSISRSIVEAHGGRIWAANNSDGGATVGFAIPRSDGPPP